MSVVEEFDALVLGSGEGGKCMAWHLAHAGQKVAVIEDRYIGGSCPNIACLPSKNIIHSASVANSVGHAAEYGTQISAFSVAMKAVQARKRAMVENLTEMHSQRFASSGATLVFGHGCFVDTRTLELTAEDGKSRQLSGRQIFLDVGAFATHPAIPGLTNAKPMTHVELLELEHCPPHLLILGGGYLALEFAQAMRRLGSVVTIIERAAQILTREDPDIAAIVADTLRSEGVEIVTGVSIESVSGMSGEQVTLHGNRKGRSYTITGSDLHVALGQSPNTRDIGLEAAGVAVTDRGYIQVNHRLETTSPNVWALGDCAGSPAFTHMSFDDFRIIRDNLAGGNRSSRGRQVPYCLFIEPELARVCLNEMEARRLDIPFRGAAIPVSSILRTRTTDETTGKLKVLIGDDDRILGFTALGARAGEMLPAVQLAMAEGLTYQSIAALIIAHPTYSEGRQTLFSTVSPRAAEM